MGTVAVTTISSDTETIKPPSKGEAFDEINDILSSATIGEQLNFLLSNRAAIIDSIEMSEYNKLVTPVQQEVDKIGQERFGGRL